MSDGTKPAAATGDVRGGDDAIAVSVVIVNWNTKDLLRDCVASIARETKRSHEAIVVDNASSDGSGAMLASEFPWVRRIENQSNRGFAAANNQGIAVARGQYVLLLNPDTVVLDGAIDRCLDLMAARSDIACLGCQVWEDERTIQRTCFKFPTLLDDLLGSLHSDRLFPNSDWLGGPWLPSWDRRSEREVDVVSGMFMLVRRDVVERVGLLDEAYFVYGEETDWCYRMHQLGLKRSFWPGARILHLDGGGKSTSQRSVAMYVQLQRSLLIFFRKYYGVVWELLLRGAYVARMVPRALGGLTRWLIGQRAAGSRVLAQSLAAMRLHLTESVARHTRPRGHG
ncbi:MAG: glycosyltransferase family 2 protein [Phycisphaerales bacterium]